MASASKMDMSPQRAFAATALALEAERRVVREGSPGTLRAALAALDAEELSTSMRLAGTALDRSEAEALVRRGVALGGHALEDYVRVSDYASAARYVRESPSSSRRRGLLTLEELVTLHALATRRTSARPGRLRETTLRGFPSGMVATPAWLIPQTLGAFVERVHAGPPPQTQVLAWIADAHARFERIHPFGEGNGRVGRLLVNLLLKRSGFVPFVFRSNDPSVYLAALRATDAGNSWPLALLLARSLSRSYAFLAAALSEGEAKPLSAFASGAERAALYKAAQRNRLRAFRRDGRLLTTAAWIDAYRARA